MAPQQHIQSPIYAAGSGQQIGWADYFRDVTMARTFKAVNGGKMSVVDTKHGPAYRIERPALITPLLDTP